MTYSELLDLIAANLPDEPATPITAAQHREIEEALATFINDSNENLNTLIGGLMGDVGSLQGLVTTAQNDIGALQTQVDAGVKTFFVKIPMSDIKNSNATPIDILLGNGSPPGTMNVNLQFECCLSGVTAALDAGSMLKFYMGSGSPFEIFEFDLSNTTSMKRFTGADIPLLSLYQPNHDKLYVQTAEDESAETVNGDFLIWGSYQVININS